MHVAGFVLLLCFAFFANRVLAITSRYLSLPELCLALELELLANY